MVGKDSFVNRLFNNRNERAKAGDYFPTDDELLEGMAFYGNDITKDIKEYSIRLEFIIECANVPELAPLSAAVKSLMANPSLEWVRVVQNAIDETPSFRLAVGNACRLRCRYYLAVFGDPHAAAFISVETALFGYHKLNEDVARQRLLPRALAWAVHSEFLSSVNHPEFILPGSSSLLALVEQRELKLRGAFITGTGSSGDSRPTESYPTSNDDMCDVNPSDAADSLGETVNDTGVIVVKAVGNANTSEGKAVAKEMHDLLNVRLQLPATPSLRPVRDRLIDEFPYAQSLIDQITTKLAGKDFVHISPTILLGPPGCGKTRFARRLGEELAVPLQLVSCGGLNDSALGGTPRRWASREPSLALSVARSTNCAGPMIILDEIEKVGDSRYNGNVHDVLIGLFEKETSSRWFDPYVEAECDLSNISWLMTANSITGVAPALRDRCRVFRFPNPGVECVQILAPRILERLYIESGYDPLWATPLEEFELQALRDYWSGGSIRELEKYVEKLKAAREDSRSQQ